MRFTKRERDKIKRAVDTLTVDGFGAGSWLDFEANVFSNMEVHWLGAALVAAGYLNPPKGFPWTASEIPHYDDVEWYWPKDVLMWGVTRHLSKDDVWRMLQ